MRAGMDWNAYVASASTAGSPHGGVDDVRWRRRRRCAAAMHLVLLQFLGGIGLGEQPDSLRIRAG